ncbi:MAG: hypothetical protein ACFFB2_09125 [Promethearchaeota archaeon]
MKQKKIMSHLFIILYLAICFLLYPINITPIQAAYCTVTIDSLYVSQLPSGIISPNQSVTINVSGAVSIDGLFIGSGVGAILIYRINNGFDRDIDMGYEWEIQIEHYNYSFSADIGPFNLGDTIDYRVGVGVGAIDIAGEAVEELRLSSVYNFTVDDVPPTITDEIRFPSTPDNVKPVTIRATVMDNQSGVNNVILHYWANNNWNSIAMIASGSRYTGVIPTQAYNTNVDYYIQATDNVGIVQTCDTFSYSISDGLGPKISAVTQNPVNADNSQPTIISATVTDDETGVASVTLYYQLNNGTWQPTSMSGSDIFTGTIPNQTYKTQVRYYIEAIDNSNNTGLYFNPLLNGNFESGSFTPWMGGASVTTDSYHIHSGAYGLSCDIYDSYSLQYLPTYIQQDVFIPVDLLEEFTFYMKSNESQVNVIITYDDDTRNNITFDSSSSWVQRVFSQENLTSGKVIINVKFERLGSPINSTTAIDDILISSSFINYVVNDGLSPVITDIIHNPDNPEDNQNVTISAIVTDADSSVDTVILYYQVSGINTWQTVIMSESDNTYTGVVPGQSYNMVVYYYIEANDMAGNSIQSGISSFTVGDDIVHTTDSETYTVETTITPSTEPTTITTSTAEGTTTTTTEETPAWTFVIVFFSFPILFFFRKKGK